MSGICMEWGRPAGGPIGRFSLLKVYKEINWVRARGNSPKNWASARPCGRLAIQKQKVPQYNESDAGLL